MIYCIWYPSGGFGHFVSAILTLYGKNFARPNDKQITFSNNGNAHAVELVAPKYQSDSEAYTFAFDGELNYAVLIDNGINSESQRFKEVFPQATTIKLCYTDQTWPIVARTMIEKAMNSSLDQQLYVDQDKWNNTSDWAQREKYFLFLRDHDLRHGWRPHTGDCNLLIEQMNNYEILIGRLNEFGIELENFSTVWEQWMLNNHRYFNPVTLAQDIVTDVKNNVNRDLGQITDIWTQAVIYYFIWVEFQKEVPHNDYADFFPDTGSIRNWLHQ